MTASLCLQSTMAVMAGRGIIEDASMDGTVAEAIIMGGTAVEAITMDGIAAITATGTNGQV